MNIKRKRKRSPSNERTPNRVKKARLTTISAVIVALITAIASVLPTLIELMR